MSNPNHRLAARALVCSLVLVIGACASSGSAGTPSTPPVSRDYFATHVRLDLVDRSRPAVDPIGIRSAPTRSLPTELYLPASHGPVPLIVFAHGYDGDPSKFTQLFQHWSDAGFAVVAPQFPITFTGASAGPLARTGDYGQQPADLTFVLDQVLRSKWKSHIDTNRIGAAGLSLGGATIWGYIGHPCCRDRRVKAAIVMDGIQLEFKGGKIQPNRIPLLMFHADHDYTLPFASARTAYANAAPPKYFVTIFAAVHAEPYENTPAASDDMVMRTTTLFWRAYLLDQKIAPGKILAAATAPGISAAEYAPPRS